MSDVKQANDFSADPQAAGEAASADEQRLFELLDRYLVSVHCGDVNSRSGLIERHPELANLMRCLDSLEILAPPPETEVEGHPRPDTPTGSDTPTELLVDGQSDSARVNGVSQQPQPSETFGRYELLEEIGRGGMGVVYRARQQDLDRDVALKMILASRLASEEDIQRFYTEARAAGSLRHPQIVGIHEVAEINGQHYFTMDYVDGDSLAELTAGGPLDDQTACECLSSVARAVDYLHEHHIVHRDLKPSNILIDGEGNPFVTDFGLAKLFDADSGLTQTGAIVGTPSYMAPEQAAGNNAEVCAQSDVYSLGAILYELLTGRPPFKRDNPLDTLVEVMEGEPTLPTQINQAVPGELELICLQCLEKDPARRYASAAALADDLDRYLRGEPVTARSTGLVHRLRRWCRREPALVSRWAALLVAASIVQIKYMINGFDLPYHLRVMTVFGVWAVVSYFFQRLLHRDELADKSRLAWAAADIGLLTTALFIAEPPLGPLLIGYPLLVVASGLFFRVRLVVFTTCVAILGYGVLVLFKEDPGPLPPPHYLIIFAAVLAVLGVIVAFQVHRIRTLSRYFDHRRLP